ncbi:MAG: Gfo/Idh/MocA family oxidoreductase [Planctomycetota bacterium]|nr:Gfo/Idh/MocA family oxidoreductase [Planctomycetaceae bacterium]MDQ3329125.1 Gfo/Idh/MocA family oxidoreductase [Planctomycetota bacterium]
MKVAVIGVGALGRHHARILASMPGVELIAVADANAAQARTIAEQHGCEWTSDYRDLLEKVEAVSIAAPTFAHREVGSACLHAGLPVLIEKPLASNVADARSLVELAERKRLPLAVGHVERFNPAYRTVKELTPRPRYIRTERVSPFAFRSTDIGVVHDLMIHDLDLALDLVNSRVTRVEAFGVSILGGHEDAANARLIFENGCVADLVVNRVNPFAQRTLQVWSETGCVNADLTSRQVSRFAPSASLAAGDSPLDRARQPGASIDQLKAGLFGQDLKLETYAVSAADALTAELTDFVESCRTGRTPRVGGIEALAALAAAERVLSCIARHQWDGTANGLTGPLAWCAQAPNAVRKAA